MQLRAFAKKPIFMAVTSALVAGFIRLVNELHRPLMSPSTSTRKWGVRLRTSLRWTEIARGKPTSLSAQMGR